MTFDTSLSVVPAGYAAIAIVSPPVNGVILYEVIDMKAIIAAVTVVIAAEFKIELGAIGLRTATLGL